MSSVIAELQSMKPALTHFTPNRGWRWTVVVV